MISVRFVLPLLLACSHLACEGPDNADDSNDTFDGDTTDAGETGDNAEAFDVDLGTPVCADYFTALGPAKQPDLRVHLMQGPWHAPTQFMGFEFTDTQVHQWWLTDPPMPATGAWSLGHGYLKTELTITDENGQSYNESHVTTVAGEGNYLHGDLCGNWVFHRRDPSSIDPAQPLDGTWVMVLGEAGQEWIDGRAYLELSVIEQIWTITGIDIEQRFTQCYGAVQVGAQQADEEGSYAHTSAAFLQPSLHGFDIVDEAGEVTARARMLADPNTMIVSHWADEAPDARACVKARREPVHLQKTGG